MRDQQTSELANDAQCGTHCVQRMVRRLRCWWRGHDMLNSSVEWECGCCGTPCGYDEAVQDSARDKLAAWWKRKHNWWRCPDCGWRFGKHNPLDDHLPF